MHQRLLGKAKTTSYSESGLIPRYLHPTLLFLEIVKPGTGKKKTFFLKSLLLVKKVCDIYLGNI